MIINRDNYQLFFIDFIDGKLTPSDEQQLYVFLNQNPDLAVELEDIESLVLIPDNEQYSQKSMLKRNETYCGLEDRFDYLCVANIENDINPSERIELNALLKSDTKKNKDYKLFNLTKLIPSQQLTYKNKFSLKRFGVFSISQRFILSAASVAAMLIVSLGIYSVIKTSTNTIENNNIAVVSVEQPIKIDTKTKEPSKTIANEKLNENIPRVIEVEATNSNEITELYSQEEELIEATTDLAMLRIQPIPSRGISQPISNFENIFISRVNQPIASENNYQLAETRTGVRDIGLFEIAQYGVNKLSSFTGSDLTLSAEKNSEGRIKKINFESNLFALSLPVKRNQ